MNENEARTLIERFAKKQQGGRFACPLSLIHISEPTRH